ncbi:putative RNA-directed DNA polymerase, partial [Aphis craccivora]
LFALLCTLITFRLLLSSAQNVRYLVLHLDRRLTWATHIHNKRLALN